MSRQRSSLFPEALRRVPERQVVGSNQSLDRPLIVRHQPHQPFFKITASCKVPEGWGRRSAKTLMAPQRPLILANEPALRIACSELRASFGITGNNLAAIIQAS